MTKKSTLDSFLSCSKIKIGTNVRRVYFVVAMWFCFWRRHSRKHSPFKTGTTSMKEAAAWGFDSCCITKTSNVSRAATSVLPFLAVTPLQTASHGCKHRVMAQGATLRLFMHEISRLHLQRFGIKWQKIQVFKKLRQMLCKKVQQLFCLSILHSC